MGGLVLAPCRQPRHCLRSNLDGVLACVHARQLSRPQGDLQQLPARIVVAMAGLHNCLHRRLDGELVILASPAFKLVVERQPCHSQQIVTIEKLAGHPRSLATLAGGGKFGYLSV